MKYSDPHPHPQFFSFSFSSSSSSLGVCRLAEGRRGPTVGQHHTGQRARSGRGNGAPDAGIDKPCRVWGEIWVENDHTLALKIGEIFGE